MEHYKLAVIGSRSFTNEGLLNQKLDERKEQIDIIVSGGADGADSLAEKWAEKNGVPTKIFDPNHERDFRGAYRIRNEKIAEECDVLIAFWDGASKGTEYTIEFARKLNKEVKVYTFQ
jgi:predicted Rossmann fold nucleotide-binding protein DprA/Smf involved in DNA uptake